MKDLEITQLIDLVVSDVPDAEGKIQKMFEWHYDRVMTLTQWILGATASLVVAVLVAFFRAELELLWWQTLIIFAAALGTGSYGIYRLFELRSLHKQYVAALKLYCGLKAMRPFLLRYRDAATRGN